MHKINTENIHKYLQQQKSSKSKNIGASQRNRRIRKLLASYRKISGFGKYCWTPKISVDLQNAGAFQNIGGCTKCWRLSKYWRMYKMLADLQNVGIWQKYRLTIESWRALKSPRLVKYQRIWKKLAAGLLFGLGGISNC
jgi:hypothetical protein